MMVSAFFVFVGSRS